jgi:hypothetical protein
VGVSCGEASSTSALAGLAGEREGGGGQGGVAGRSSLAPGPWTPTAAHPAAGAAGTAARAGGTEAGAAQGGGRWHAMAVSSADDEQQGTEAGPVTRAKQQVAGCLVVPKEHLSACCLNLKC